MLDVEFYRLYNGIWARDLIMCLRRDFLRFSQKFAVFFTIFLPCFSIVPKRIPRQWLPLDSSS